MQLVCRGQGRGTERVRWQRAQAAWSAESAKTLEIFWGSQRKATPSPARKGCLPPLVQGAWCAVLVRWLAGWLYWLAFYMGGLACAVLCCAAF